MSWLCCGTVLRSTGGAQRRVGKQAHSGLWSLLASLLGGDVDRADRPIAVTLGVLLYFNLVYCSLQLARVHWHPAALLLLAATLHVRPPASSPITTWPRSSPEGLLRARPPCGAEFPGADAAARGSTCCLGVRVCGRQDGVA